MMRIWMIAALVGLAGNVCAANDGLKVLHGRLQQAGFLVGTVPVGSKVSLDGVPVWVGEKGQMMVGFDRMAKPKAELKICQPSKACVVRVLSLKQRDYVTQNVKGVPAASVNPDPTELAVMAADNGAIKAARRSAMSMAGYNDAFMHVFNKPIEGVTTGVFGSRRTYNGEERSWHKGRDFASPVGTLVHAPADGTVRLARSTFMSGNLIMIDHGAGMSTVYAHLSKMLVKPGDKVKAGDVIGKVGTTGRSTGPHLHWGAYWKSMAIDPILWVKD